MIFGAGRPGPLTAWPCGLWVLAAVAAVAHAQTPSESTAYQDRYIAGGTLRPDVSTGDPAAGDGSALARSLRVDAVLSVLEQEGPNSGPRTQENGLIADAQWDSASYGAWSADAGARSDGGSRSGAGNNYGTAAFSLHQR